MHILGPHRKNRNLRNIGEPVTSPSSGQVISVSNSFWYLTITIFSVNTFGKTEVPISISCTLCVVLISSDSMLTS